jgi:O-antigen ligase
MRALLVALIALVVVVNLFDMKMSLGTGLTAENALLYTLAAGILFKLVVQQPFVFHLRAVHVCFIVLVLYSVFSYLTAAFVVEYPRYDLLDYGIALKSRLVDYVTYFLVFFYGLRETRNAHAIWKVLVFAVCLGSAMALLSVLGVVEIGAVGQNKDERLEGLIGEPNQDAAFLCLFIPGIAAVMMGSSGFMRIAWFGGMLAALGAFFLTASRGGLLALIVASAWGAVLFRRYIPFRAILRAGAWAAGIGAMLLVALSARYGRILYRRFVEDSVSTDVASASSGRLEMWTNALENMADKPITLLTGFGWEVYWLMPFRYAPHNTYLGLYFNLGVVGLMCWVLLMWLLVREARAALPYAAPEHRPILMSFGFGVLAISIATFFVDLYQPWIWFWAYAGIVMRIAVNARSTADARRAETVAPAPASELVRRDAFGWVGSAHR